jgi:CheY-like chemotaxis protein
MTRKILVADDSATIHKIVNLTFAQEDFAVESVLNGEQAIEKALDIRPDVILADVFMPGLNGYQVCEQIKANPDLSHIPVLLLVGSFETFDEAEASRVRCNGHLTKPFDTSELIHMVQSLVIKAPKADTSKQLAVGAAQAAGDFPQLGLAMAPNLSSAKTKESFLGTDRIFDVFGRLLRAGKPAATASAADEALPQETPAVSELVRAISAPADNVIALSKAAEAVPAKGSASELDRQIELSDETLDAIAEKLVRRMSSDVVREIAWEVVPELADTLIRQWLKEHDSSEGVASVGKSGDAVSGSLD